MAGKTTSEYPPVRPSPLVEGTECCRRTVRLLEESSIVKGLDLRQMFFRGKNQFSLHNSRRKTTIESESTSPKADYVNGHSARKTASFVALFRILTSHHRMTILCDDFALS